MGMQNWTPDWATSLGTVLGIVAGIVAGVIGALMKNRQPITHNERLEEIEEDVDELKKRSWTQSERIARLEGTIFRQ